ncbi:MAG TPA: NRDE family protein [Steroidobacteraceae bacterium]|nr:NRDE family protein [Steroidobacteraceae bacterium]
MCLLVMAWRAHPRYRLVVAANRDEFHARPTAPMGIWHDLPDILAGRDLSAQGTWLAVDRQRRFGIITNYRDLQAGHPEAPSRGGLIPGWLRERSGPAAYLAHVARDASAYAGFNLLLNDAESLCYASNRAPEFSTALTPGVYGLSNLLLDTPWPKLTRVRAKFEQWLAVQPPVAAPPEAASETLFALLADRTRSLPDAPPGAPPLPAEWTEVLSAPFVVHPTFGTRCSTLVLIGYDGSLIVQERRFDPQGATLGQSGWTLAPGEWPALNASP